MKKNLLLSILMAVFTLMSCQANNAGSESTPTKKTADNKMTKVELETSYGNIVVELYNETPQHRDNFIKLVESGYYDGVLFHRVIKGFMIQGGDPLGNGTGGSDKTIKGEFSGNGVNNPLKHTRGVISMARSSDPNSASSQFFIMHEDAPHLDGQYAAFGKVTEGMEVVDKIANDAKPVDGNGTIPSSKQPVINSIKITEK